MGLPDDFITSPDGADGYFKVDHIFTNKDEIELVNLSYVTKDDGNDLVNKPNHYKIFDIQVLDIINECLTEEEFIGYLKGNCIKYQLRAKKKGGNQDWCKSGFYNKMLKDILEDES